MKIKELGLWNDLNTIEIPDGYHRRLIPDLTRDNLMTIINKQNEIIEALNKLLEKE